MVGPVEKPRFECAYSRARIVSAMLLRLGVGGVSRELTLEDREIINQSIPGHALVCRLSIDVTNCNWMESSD